MKLHLQAFKDLVARYAAIGRTAWQLRHELAGPARLADEAAFLPAALSLQETPPHPAPRRTALAICALFTLALGWACLGELDVVAVAPGRVMVNQGSQLIQPLQAGVVNAIHVRDGQHVRAGELLVELDGTEPEADSHRVEQTRADALAERLRSQALAQALATGQAPVVPAGASAGTLTAEQRSQAQTRLAAEWAEIQAQKTRLQAGLSLKQAEAATVDQQIAKAETTLPMLRQREQDMQSLSAQGFIAHHASQDRQRERIELERDLATLRARHSETQAAIGEATQQLRAWQAETARQLRERQDKADLNLAQLGEEGAKLAQRQLLTRLVAPVTGTVQQLAVHTTGGVVTPAQVLMLVVPDQAELSAEVTLENKDIGFVKAGQSAEIKLETFPYTRWGSVPGTVEHVSRDAVIDDKRGAIFVARVRLAKTHLDIDGEPIAISPGMNLSAEIMTGRRRVINYLLSPLQQRVGEGLRER